MDVSQSLSKIDARIKKLERWKSVLSEMLADAEGKETLKEVASSLNGNHPTVPREQRRLVMPQRTQTKSSLIDAAIVDAAEGLNRSFSSHEIMDILSDRGFHFSREDRMTEVGASMRRLLASGRVAIEKEKEGTVGRLYQLILP